MEVAARGGEARQGHSWARRMLALAAVIALGLTVSACNFDLGGEAKYPSPNRQKPGSKVQYEDDPGVFGAGGLFGPKLPDDQGGGAGSIGVNNLWWRPSLDTVSFMPLVSADPFGGGIITGLEQPPHPPRGGVKGTT